VQQGEAGVALRHVPAMQCHAISSLEGLLCEVQPGSLRGLRDRLLGKKDVVGFVGDHIGHGPAHGDGKNDDQAQQEFHVATLASLSVVLREGLCRIHTDGCVTYLHCWIGWRTVLPGEPSGKPVL